MLPKDLLKDLETGNRTIEVLKEEGKHTINPIESVNSLIADYLMNKWIIYE